ncbi:MAG TPA: dephospho-CoA kinase [Nitrosospira sp.]|nr:dephospho-CoA kinase [Nitrosospira sp.]
MRLIVGLTGGIGSGKTSAAKLFETLGADVVDTDVIAHELTQREGAAIEAIRQAFGEKYVTDDAALNRESMRELVFSHEDARLRLEGILHPLIRAEVTQRIADFNGPYGIIVIPLLFEAGGYREIVRRVLVIDCSEDIQLARTTARKGMDERTARAIIAAQLPRLERIVKADDVIVNDLDMDHLRLEVEALHKKYRALTCTG